MPALLSCSNAGHLPLAISHTWPPSPPVAKRVPSGLNATLQAYVHPVAPSNVAVHVPLAISHTLAHALPWPSFLPVAKRVPSGLNAMLRILWPSNVAMHVALARSHTLALSSQLDAKRMPSGLNATLFTYSPLPCSVAHVHLALRGQPCMIHSGACRTNEACLLQGIRQESERGGVVARVWGGGHGWRTTGQGIGWTGFSITECPMPEAKHSSVLDDWGTHAAPQLQMRCMRTCALFIDAAARHTLLEDRRANVHVLRTACTASYLVH
eukprot:354551-Chlamydomonas_euryale.AAC.3